MGLLLIYFHLKFKFPRSGPGVSVEFSPEFNTTLDVTVPAASDVDDEERERRKRLPGETEDEYIQRAFTDLMQTLYDRGLLKRVRFGRES